MKTIRVRKKKEERFNTKAAAICVVKKCLKKLEKILQKKKGQTERDSCP